MLHKDTKLRMAWQNLKVYKDLEMLLRMAQLRWMQHNEQEQLAKTIIAFVNNTEPKNPHIKRER